MVETIQRSEARSPSDGAFRGLIEKYINLVYSSALRQLRDAHLAEDATQAVFILLHQRAAKIPAGRTSSWLLTATRFTCANIRKTERRRAHREQVAAMHSIKTDESDELLSLLDAALAKLPSGDREAIALHYLQEASYAEVAARLRITEEAARKRTSRALEKLRDYFARHGVATNAAALATLLPTQAHAMTSPLRDAMTHSILQTCHGGASSSAAALAKGTHLMMFLNTAKPVAAALLVAVAGVAGWWTLSTHADVVASQAVPAEAITLDLTTPEKAIESFCKALQVGDRTSAYAATTAAPPATPTNGSVFMSLNLGQNRLIRAAAKAFNSNGQEARRFMTVDMILLKLLAYNRSQNKAAVISGDTATIAFDLPAALLENAPAAVRKQVAAFADHPIRLVKQGNDWKLNSSSDVAITLLDKDNHLVEDPALKIKVVQEYADAFDKCAGEVEKGSYITWEEAEPHLKADIEKLHTDHNLSDIEVEVLPKN